MKQLNIYQLAFNIYLFILLPLAAIPITLGFAHNWTADTTQFEFFIKSIGYFLSSFGLLIFGAIGLHFEGYREYKDREQEEFQKDAGKYNSDVAKLNAKQ